MRVLNDYRCTECGVVNEHFVENSVTEVACQDCGAIATKVQPVVRCNLDPISGSFPGATMSWEKQREQHMALERKHSSYNPERGTLEDY